MNQLLFLVRKEGEKGERKEVMANAPIIIIINPRNPPERREKTEENKSEAFKDKGSRRISGKEEGVKGEKRGKEMEGRAVCKLQKASDGGCCRRQP